jgi:UDP-glucose 4-epimerase
MRAIVTGGAGFIGSNIVDALTERGDEVTVIDDLSTGKRENLDLAVSRGARLCVLDIRDAEQLSGVIDEAAPHTIFHLAAQIDVRRSLAEPAWDATINVAGTINVLEAARRHGVARIVNSSTGGAIYGDAETIPSSEATTPLPEAAYGQSKLSAEGYLGLYERLYGQSSVTLRYGNVYGPRQDPLGEAGVVAIFTGLLESGGQPTVFGDGTQTRDYVYVGDVVAANLAAAQADVHGAINIGTGVETSVLELIAVLRELAGAESFEPRFEPARLGELARSCLDVTLARETLGWTPSVTVREGLRLTFEASRAAPTRCAPPRRRAR